MLECTIISPLSEIELSPANALYVRAANGELGILPGHAPMVCGLAARSVARLVLGDGERRFRLGRGSFLTVTNDRITLLSADFAEEPS